MNGLSSFGSFNHGAFNPLPEQQQPVAAAGSSSAKTAALPAVGEIVSSMSSTGAVPAAAASVRSGLSDGGATGGSSHAGGGGSMTTSQLAQQELVSGYSMTAGGQQYDANVEQSGGDYTAFIANVPGGTATSSSELAAEHTLQLRIDELV
jgi:hypothetical protein